MHSILENCVIINIINDLAIRNIGTVLILIKPGIIYLDLITN